MKTGYRRAQLACIRIKLLAFMSDSGESTLPSRTCSCCEAIPFKRRESPVIQLPDNFLLPATAKFMCTTFLICPGT